MKITNKYNLPAPLVAAIARDPYTKGKANYSITELLDSPRIARLKQRHYSEIERDASEFVWTLMGRAMHHVLELSAQAMPEHVSEHRFFLTVGDVVVSGGVDLMEEGEALLITDYKMTSAYNVMTPKLSWEQQLNLYDYLCFSSTGRRADGLRVVAVVRDWQKRQAMMNPQYPSAPIISIPIKQWSRDEQETFLKLRISLHQAGSLAEMMDDDLPLCSKEERWVRPDLYAVKWPSRKRAIKIFETKEEAEELAASLGDDHYVEARPGEPTRCAEYCEVSRFCNQWQAERSSFE